jgi:hypothetical protein
LSKRAKFIYFWYKVGSSSENWRTTGVVGNPVTLIIPVMYFEMAYRFSNADKGLMISIII